MNIYDIAHNLAKEIRSSEEFIKLNELNKKVMANPSNKEMIEDFRKKAIEFQVSNYGKEKPDEKELEKLQKLQNALMMNSEVAEYLMAEMRFSQIFEDINKIILESAKLDD